MYQCIDTSRDGYSITATITTGGDHVRIVQKRDRHILARQVIKLAGWPGNRFDQVRLVHAQVQWREVDSRTIQLAESIACAIDGALRAKWESECRPG